MHYDVTQTNSSNQNMIYDAFKTFLGPKIGFSSVKATEDGFDGIDLPIAATVDDPFSLVVHQTSPISKPNAAHATWRYAWILSGSMVETNNKTDWRWTLTKPLCYFGARGIYVWNGWSITFDRRVNQSNLFKMRDYQSTFNDFCQYWIHDNLNIYSEESLDFFWTKRF